MCKKTWEPSCFSSLSFHCLPQSYSGYSTMNRPVHMGFLPTLSFGHRHHSLLLYSEVITLQQGSAQKTCAFLTNPSGLSNALSSPLPPAEERLRPVLCSKSISSFYSSPSRGISPHLRCSSPCYFLCSSMCEYCETWLVFLAFILSNLPFDDGSLMSFTAKMFVQPLLACC